MIHQNFYYYFTIMFLKSLTAWINQTITQYKVLNLVKVPYLLKKSSNLKTKLVSLSVATRSYEITTKPRWTSWCWVNPNINEWYYSCRLGSAAFKLAETYWLRVNTWLQIPFLCCLDSWDSATIYDSVHALKCQICTLKNINWCGK